MYKRSRESCVLFCHFFFCFSVFLFFWRVYSGVMNRSQLNAETFALAIGESACQKAPHTTLLENGAGL